MHRSTQNLVEEALSIARYMKYACAPQLSFFLVGFLTHFTLKSKEVER